MEKNPIRENTVYPINTELTEYSNSDSIIDN